MCGRYVLTAPGEVLAGIFELDEKPRIEPRWNIAPTQEVAIVRASASGGRELVRVRWGLVPHWAKELAIGNRLINARAETLAEKPAYRDSLRRRRCLVPADGFYEWQRLDGRKQPWLLRLRSRESFAFAGLWARWTAGAEPVESCTIVTGEPNELVAPLHDRMPVILPRPAWARWLDPAIGEPAALAPLLVPLPAGEMEAVPVSTRVNDPRHDEPGCIEPLAAMGSLADSG